ncbi:MAG TPA: phosphatase PAP2 family protein [Marmoricola sp.]|nr:phosphatase PAP2 family protein [Marmoricola sp.]
MTTVEQRASVPVKRPVLWHQLSLGLVLFGLYLLVDSLESPARRVAADAHGRAIFDLEQRLHLDVEHTLNAWLAPHDTLSTLANYEYAWTYILSAVALLVWTTVRRPDLWPLTRDSFVVMNLIAFATFWLFPVTPPRLLPELGFVDTVSRGQTVGSWGSGLVDSANQLAAMPSLHVGWALWVSVVLARITARRWVQLFSAVHVVLTAYVIMATANHYLLDAVAVVVPVLIGVRFASALHETPGTVVPSCDAFFLHVESTGTAQHVGGLVLLAPGNQPPIEQVRAVVRDGLARMPRMHQRLAERPSRWRRLRWVDVDEADLDWHVTERFSDDGMAGLRRIMGELAEQPMPRDRPLWRVVLVRDILPDTSALVFLAHHAIADGIGTVLHSFQLFEPLVSLPVPTGRAPGPLQRAAAVTVGLAQLATDGGAGKLPPSSLRRAFDVVDVDLEVVRRAAAARQARVTDLVLALTADAMHAVAPELAARAHGKLRFSVPMMVRTPDTTAEGNATAAVMIDVPMDGRPFDELLAEIGHRTRRLRRPTRAMASRFVMATGLRLLPEPCAGWFARTVYGSRFFHAVVSNMPGPTETLRFCGKGTHRTYPILPVAPGTPLALGALSWSGVLGISMATDPAMLDAAAMAARMDATLKRLAVPSESGPGAAPGSGQRPLEGEEQARA